MSVAEQEIKERVITVLDELSDEKMKEVLDFALFLQIRPPRKEMRSQLPSHLLR